MPATSGKRRRIRKNEVVLFQFRVRVRKNFWPNEKRNVPVCLEEHIEKVFVKFLEFLVAFSTVEANLSFNF
jgi:hypothetical protein